MLELIGLERTGFLVFVNIIMLLLAYVIFKPALNEPFCISTSRRNFGLFIILSFCLFAFWGNDWFHIAISYQYLKQGEFSHLEELYTYLIQNICPDYLTFRLVVWGVALVFLGQTIKSLKIEKDIAWLCFVAVGLLWFSYARVSLAMSIMFYALSIYNSENNKLRNKFFAVLLLIGSYYCHKSALFGIILVIVSSHIHKLDKKTLLLMGLGLPLLYIMIDSFLSHYMTLQEDTIGDAWAMSIVSAQSYMDREVSETGLGLLLQQILERSTYILIAFIGIKISSNKSLALNIPNRILAFIKLLVLMVLIAFMFQFDFGFNTSLIADRFFRFSFIPSSLLLAYCIRNNIYPKYSKFAFHLGLCATFYELFYCLYMYK